MDTLGQPRTGQVLTKSASLVLAKVFLKYHASDHALSFYQVGLSAFLDATPAEHLQSFLCVFFVNLSAVFKLSLTPAFGNMIINSSPSCRYMAAYISVSCTIRRQKSSCAIVKRTSSTLIRLHWFYCFSNFR